MADSTNKSTSNALKKEKTNNVSCQPANAPPPPPPVPHPPVIRPAAQPPPRPIVESFFWFEVDRVNFPDMALPYIIKNNIKYVSIKMVEKEVLSKFASIDSPEVREYGHLQSTNCTEAECELFNDINFNHCMGKFGTDAHTSDDGTVSLEDFMKFYEIVKRTCRTIDGKILVGSNFATGSNSARESITPDFVLRNSTNPVEERLNGRHSLEVLNPGSRAIASSNATGSSFEPQQQQRSNSSVYAAQLNAPPLLCNQSYMLTQPNRFQQPNAVQHQQYHQANTQRPLMMNLQHQQQQQQQQQQQNMNLRTQQHTRMMQSHMQPPHAYLQQRMTSVQSNPPHYNALQNSIQAPPRNQVHPSNGNCSATSTPSPTYMTDTNTQHFFPMHQNLTYAHNGYTQPGNMYSQQGMPAIPQALTSITQVQHHQQRPQLNAQRQVPSPNQASSFADQSVQINSTNNRQATSNGIDGAQLTNISYQQQNIVNNYFVTNSNPPNLNNAHQQINTFQAAYSMGHNNNSNGQSSTTSNQTHPAMGSRLATPVNSLSQPHLNTAARPTTGSYQNTEVQPSNTAFRTDSSNLVHPPAATRPVPAFLNSQIQTVQNATRTTSEQIDHARTNHNPDTNVVRPVLTAFLVGVATPARIMSPNQTIVSRLVTPVNDRARTNSPIIAVANPGSLVQTVVQNEANRVVSLSQILETPVPDVRNPQVEKHINDSTKPENNPATKEPILPTPDASKSPATAVQAPAPSLNPPAAKSAEPRKDSSPDSDIIIISDDESSPKPKTPASPPAVLKPVKEEPCKQPATAAACLPEQNIPAKTIEAESTPEPVLNEKSPAEMTDSSEGILASIGNREQVTIVELTQSIAENSLRNLKIVKKIRTSNMSDFSQISRSSSVDSVTPPVARNLLQINDFVVPYTLGAEYRATAHNKLCTKYLPCQVLAQLGLIPKESASNIKLLKEMFPSFCFASNDQAKQLKSAMITSLRDETFDTTTGLVCLSDLLINYLDRPVYMKCLKDQAKLVPSYEVLFKLRGGVILYHGKDSQELIPYMQSGSRILALQSCVKNLLAELNEEVRSEAIESIEKIRIRRFFQLMLFYFNYDSSPVYKEAEPCLVDIAPLIAKYPRAIIINNEFTKNFPKDWNAVKKKDRLLNNKSSSVALSPSSIVSSSSVSPVVSTSKLDVHMTMNRSSSICVIASAGSVSESFSRKNFQKEVAQSISSFNEMLKKRDNRKALPAEGSSRPEMYASLVNSLKRSLSYDNVLAMSKNDIDKIEISKERFSRSESVKCLCDKCVCSEEIIIRSKKIDIIKEELRVGYKLYPPLMFRNLLKISLLNLPSLKKKAFTRRYKTFMRNIKAKNKIPLLQMKVKEERMEVGDSMTCLSPVVTTQALANQNLNASRPGKIQKTPRHSKDSAKLAADSHTPTTSKACNFLSRNQTTSKRKSAKSQHRPGKSKKYRYSDSSTSTDTESELSFNLEVTEQDEKNYRTKRKHQKTSASKRMQNEISKPKPNVIRPDIFSELYTTESFDEEAQLRKFRDPKLTSKCTVKIVDLRQTYPMLSLAKAIKETSFFLTLSPKKNQTCKKQTNLKTTPSASQKIDRSSEPVSSAKLVKRKKSISSVSSASSSLSSQVAVTKKRGDHRANSFSSVTSSESSITSLTKGNKRKTIAAVRDKAESSPVLPKQVRPDKAESQNSTEAKYPQLMKLKQKKLSSLVDSIQVKNETSTKMKATFQDSDDSSSDLPDLQL